MSSAASGSDASSRAEASRFYDDGNDIDQLYLVVPNHGRQGMLTGGVEASAKNSCSHELHIGGTITWTAESHVHYGDIDQTETVSGTAQIVILVKDSYLLIAERGGGSTYSYDYSNNFNCPSSHEAGTLESGAGVGGTERTDYSIAILNPGAPLGEDLHLQIIMPDYCGPPQGSSVDPSTPSFSGFPDCEEGGDQMYARFDGVENYVIDCPAIFGWGGVDSNTPNGSVTGHVTGTLRPLDGPHPTPPR